MKLFDNKGDEISISDIICDSLKNNLRIEILSDNQYQYYNEGSSSVSIIVKIYFNDVLISENTEVINV